MARQIVLKTYPAIHRHIHGVVKKRIGHGFLFSTEVLRSIIRHTIYHVPEKSRWETIDEMCEMGMLKKINKKKYEWIYIKYPKRRHPCNWKGEPLF